MKANELNFFKELILEKRREVLNRLSGSHLVDIGNEEGRKNTNGKNHVPYMDNLWDHTRSLEDRSYDSVRMKKYLSRLDESLIRIEKGEYGVCLGCRKQIPRERLKYVPHTRWCVKCKSQS